MKKLFKNNKKRIIAFALSFVLILQCSGCFYNYNNEVTHGNVDFSQMSYEHYDTANIYNLIDEINSLSGNFFNFKKVYDKYNELNGMFTDLQYSAALAAIYNSLDATDQYYIDEYNYTTEQINLCTDAFLEVSKKIIDSKCGGLSGLFWGTDYVKYIKSSVGYTDEQIELMTKEQELISEYNRLSVKDYSLEEEDSEDYVSVDMTSKNAELGQVFVDLCNIRNQIAVSYGYDNYIDYSYEKVYARDYTNEQVLLMCDATKKYMLDITNSFITSEEKMYDASYKLEEKLSDNDCLSMLELSKPYFEEISDDLKTSYDYMIEYNLFSLDQSDVKTPTCYTTLIPKQNAPFMFVSPMGGFYDMDAIAHEFGHYNAFYKDPYTLSSATATDICEIHSQGLEVLMLDYYDEMFGDECAKYAEFYVLENLTYSIVRGCMLDEFQQKVYSMSDLTVEKINDVFEEVAASYGITNENYENIKYYWVEVPHNFIAPFYYISYAVSGIPVLQLWDVSNSDQQNAIDDYNELVDLGGNYTYSNALNQISYDNTFENEESADSVIYELSVSINKFLSEDLTQ